MSDRSARVLLVSNRLPVTARMVDGRVRLDMSAGGLATGLRGLHENESSESLWIGWPGETGDLDAGAAADLSSRLAEKRLIPVDLTPEEILRYYEGYSNGVLWPLFHYMPGRIPLHVPDWDAYESVNRKFAEAIAKVYLPGDRLWVHDYQLMLVPGMVRELLPNAHIGFFLHIPFPASEMFRTLPHRAKILEGLLGADLIGFHTAAYMRHFATSVLRILGASVDVERVSWEGRRVALGVFPMGIDAERYAKRAADPEVAELVRGFRANPGERIVVGIDRLDYSKGLPRRLLSYEKLLEDHPELRGKIRLIQVAVPSRTGVDAYRDFRQEIDSIVGRIVGAFATPSWVPVHYLYRGISEAEIVALYCAADVMLVTPLRDGMNLVAKEFVASRVDGDGVLLLSEFAGAAAELAEAVQVNPYDIDETAAAIHLALSMPEEERRTRMSGMRRRVFAHDIHQWLRSFLQRLAEPAIRDATVSPSSAIDDAAGRARRAHRLVLLLDYDGTLVPFAATPDLARPDGALLGLLRSLAARPRTEVHILSGRIRPTLERWFASIPVGLHAEYGYWSRPQPDGEWMQMGSASSDAPWMERVASILEEFASRTPGSLVERKTGSLAWHWRTADPEFGALQAKELRLHLTEILSNAPVAVLTGEKVIDIRPHAVNKGLVASTIPDLSAPGTVCLALGDDGTDEDLFGVLPEGSITIKAGPGATRAQLVIDDIAGVRAFLRALLA